MNKVYIVAKTFKGTGSLIYLCKDADEAKELVKLLNSKKVEGLQIVVLNDPNSYPEYTPYTILENKNSFLENIKNVIKINNLQMNTI